MIGYAIGSFIGMFLISLAYGLASGKMIKVMGNKVTQAWKHRPARFIILSIYVIQIIFGFTLFIASCYLLYSGATYVPDPEYAMYNQGGQDITTAWEVFGVSLAMSVVADMIKGIFVLTFAD